MENRHIFVIQPRRKESLWNKKNNDTEITRSRNETFYFLFLQSKSIRNDHTSDIDLYDCMCYDVQCINLYFLETLNLHNLLWQQTYPPQHHPRVGEKGKVTFFFLSHSPQARCTPYMNIWFPFPRVLKGYRNRVAGTTNDLVPAKELSECIFIFVHFIFVTKENIDFQCILTKHVKNHVFKYRTAQYFVWRRV